MRANLLRLFPLLFILTSLVACDKTTTETIDGYDYQPERLTELMPLVTGKYITYRLDSTVFTNFGTTTEFRSYQEKNIIDGQFKDAAGNTSYRVYRYTRDTSGTIPWKSAGSYYITPFADRIEVVENNLRLIKLIAPVRKDVSWKGNSYVTSNPFEQAFGLVYVDMKSWNYTYKSITDAFAYKQQTLNNVATVLHVDERFGVDTVDVIDNKATIKRDSATAVWLRGNATDTVRITAVAPAPGIRSLTIYNQTNNWATLNGIKIRRFSSLDFEYANNKWFYPNVLNVVNNKVTVPRGASLVYIFGTATDSIKVDVSQVDTLQTRKLTIYNHSNFKAFAQFPSLNLFPIPPGFGRSYEILSKNWVLYQLNDAVTNEEPYSTDLRIGNTNYSVEKYAKGIGLVYQELILWEFQPNSGGVGGYKVGFGIRRSMIDHN